MSRQIIIAIMRTNAYTGKNFRSLWRRESVTASFVTSIILEPVVSPVVLIQTSDRRFANLHSLRCAGSRKVRVLICGSEYNFLL